MNNDTKAENIYICQTCGQEYDESLGCFSKAIPAHTPFADLPECWTCPICNAPKDAFIKKEC